MDIVSTAMVFRAGNEVQVARITKGTNTITVLTLSLMAYSVFMQSAAPIMIIIRTEMKEVTLLDKP